MVVGGGIAGLSVCATLAKHANEVILLERGKRLDYPQVRKTIPQGHHIHILLKAGQDKLDKIYPGFSEHLISDLKDEGFGTARVEGLEAGDWVLIDTGDIIIHVFRPEVREFYNIEKMWAAPDLEEETRH